MKKSRFTGSQIVAVLKPAEGVAPVPALCRERDKLCISPHFKTRRLFGGPTRTRTWNQKIMSLLH